MVAQFAAEATLRRVHAAQKDDDMPPIEAILAPLEAELRLARQEVLLYNKALPFITLVQEVILTGLAILICVFSYLGFKCRLFHFYVYFIISKFNKLFFLPIKLCLLYTTIAF